MIYNQVLHQNNKKLDFHYYLLTSNQNSLTIGLKIVQGIFVTNLKLGIQNKMYFGQLIVLIKKTGKKKDYSSKINSHH